VTASLSITHFEPKLGNATMLPMPSGYEKSPDCGGPEWRWHNIIPFAVAVAVIVALMLWR
jgi:hypothetical protein